VERRPEQLLAVHRRFWPEKPSAGRGPAGANGRANGKARGGPDARERAIAYLAQCPPAVSGQNGHGQTFDVARAVVYGFEFGVEAGLELLLRHYNPKCVPEWTEAELRHKCQDADTKPFDKPRGWLLNEDRRAGQRGGHAGNCNAGPGDERPSRPKTFTLGPLTLRPGRPRQTASGKISVPVTAEKAGKVVYPFVISTAASGRAAPARTLAAQFLTDDAEAAGKVDAALIEVLAWADEHLRKAPAAAGPTVREVVKAAVPPEWLLTHRTARGAWSESKQREVSRAEFIVATPEALLQACGGAADAPRDLSGRPCRPELLRLVEMELKVLWADLVADLPLERDADLPPTSAAAAAFRGAMIRLWTRTQTFEVVKGTTEAGDVASRSSLVSRVLSQHKKDGRPGGRTSWRAVQSAFDAWHRTWVDADGEEHVLLAMRHRLADQVGVTLPGVTDQTSLNDIGKRFGVLQDPPEKVPAVLSGGKVRLAILSLDLTRELLEQPPQDPVPMHGPEANAREPGQEG
jgi:hypothetical protein